jgi:hypothetical protein
MSDTVQLLKNLKADIAGTHKSLNRETTEIIQHMRSLRLEVIYIGTTTGKVISDLQRLLDESIKLHKLHLISINSRTNSVVNGFDATLEKFLREETAKPFNEQNKSVTDHVDALSEYLDFIREDLSRVIAEVEEF